MYVSSRRQEDADSFVFPCQEQHLNDSKQEVVHQIFMMQTFQRAFKGHTNIIDQTEDKSFWSVSFFFLIMYV